MTSTAESTSASGPPAAPPLQQPTPESPLHEMGRRFADQAPLWPVAHAAGLQNMRGIWEDSRIKRKMDRLMAARQLGLEDSIGEDDEMPGEITIKGDETHYHYGAPP